MYIHASTMWDAEETKQEGNTWNRILTVSMGMQLVKTCKQNVHFSFQVFSVALPRLYLNVISVC